MEHSERLPSPPPLGVSQDFPSKALEIKRNPMARNGFGYKGQKIQLLTNHFNVKVAKTNGHFFHYSVSITYEDGSPVDAKGIGRKVLDKVQQTYESEFSGKDFAYDGEKSLFTIGSLPNNKLQFTIVLEDLSSNRLAGSGSPEASSNEMEKKRSRRPYRSKTYNVVISYAAKVPMQSIVDALNGKESEHFQEAVRVLDIILSQHAAKQGCLLVRQSFFHNEPRNFSDLGGGVLGCRGFHSSFRATQGGLSLNMDVSTTMIVKPGPVVDFLVENQNVREPYQIDWAKAKRTLKNLRIKTRHSNAEYKITGLSDKICQEQIFSFKQGKGDISEPVEITVYKYFVDHCQIPLGYSANFPCINVGKSKRPVFIPLELCSLVSLQRYTKALSGLQRASLVEKSRQKPQERMRVLTNALKDSNYSSDGLLASSGIEISSQFSAVEGRVLPAPELRVGNNVGFYPQRGRWNFNNKKFVKGVAIENWAVINFSARCNIHKLCEDLVRCGDMKGISISRQYDIFEERPQDRRAPAYVRVDKMFETIRTKLRSPPRFFLCILPEKKNSDIYGPWKRMCLAVHGVVTQCLAPTKINDQYLTNLLLKINAKLDGTNSLLTIEQSRAIPLVSKVPTIIVGMDVSHGSPGCSDVPSVAAVVSSRQWPSISNYRAVVRTQSPKTEMIDSLHKKVSDSQDDGIFRELLVDFYINSGKRKPEQIIIFRDGVSESQFSQVLNIELDQIVQACKLLDEEWSPRFMVIVAQKNHHTKFFQTNSADNVLPGTVVDKGICNPRNNDFYMCAHAGMIGTTRPTHYHVLHDELGFSVDDLQEFVHSLSYVYQKSTTAVSVVAPICYAHLAAAQASKFVKLEDFSETSSSTLSGGSVPELPKLHPRVCSSMFFC